jgi:uncharacterized NAD(P)/FAD-binding protein YdhS
MSTVVIIGGGFSGTITAVHLLRRGLGAAGRLVLVNRSGAMARGVAYGTTSEMHVLNVPAGRMSAFEDDPDDFARFVRERGVAAGGGSFVGRHLYGAYLESLLADACARATEGVVQRLSTEVVQIEPAADHTHAWVSLRDGVRIRADRVVLAVGNYPPADPHVDGGDFFTTSGRGRYVRDPWSRDAFDAVDLQAPMLLIGTGLTMVDIALQLHALGASGVLTAVSRRGLLPQPHRHPAQLPETHDLPPGLLEGAPTMRAYVRAVRRHIRETAARGVDWRDAVAALRPVTPRLWRALSTTQRGRFLRHLRPFWEVHRHRMAPPLHDAFIGLRRAGRVNILAGRLLTLREREDCDGGGVLVRVRPRGSHEVRELQVGTVINCSGPAGDTRRLRDPLFDQLRARGLLRPDALGLGIDTSPTGALIGRDGAESRVLYYVGPFLRARDWEATAVPELRQYARQMADHLLATLTGASIA